MAARWGRTPRGAFLATLATLATATLLCAGAVRATPAAEVALADRTAVSEATDGVEGPADARPRRARATFAGGCFWCMEPPYDALDGVRSTTSGYAGGDQPNPTYEAVAHGRTGHHEVVQVVYDPAKISYTKLLEVFWHNIDPLDDGGQFCDRGDSYTTAIFYHNAEQRRLAEASKQRLQQAGIFDQPIVTPIEPLNAFYPAEDDHQNYYRNNAVRYKLYRWNCGRDQRLETLWGDAAGK